MNTTINTLKIVATILVFVCHCGIVCNESFGFELANNWQILLKTPAWGGVFIFFIISGFLACKSFSSGLLGNRHHIKIFLKKKFLNIYVPCLLFISLAYILTDPEGKLTWMFLLKILTCTFNGTGGGIKYIGASWYVFVLMWLYVLTPVFYRAIESWEEKHRGIEFKGYFRLISVIAVMGCVYRISGRALGLEWYSGIYANVIGNLDLFVSGMIAHRMTQFLPSLSHNGKRLLIYGNAASLAILIVVCCFFYYYGEKDCPSLIHIYKYVFPTFFLVTTGCLLIYSEEADRLMTRYGFFRKVTGLIVPYTFMFYLWHSIIFAIFANKIHIDDGFAHYIITLLIGSLVTGYVSVLMTTMNKGIRNLFNEWKRTS